MFRSRFVRHLLSIIQPFLSFHQARSSELPDALLLFSDAMPTMPENVKNMKTVVQMNTRANEIPLRDILPQCRKLS